MTKFGYHSSSLPNRDRAISHLYHNYDKSLTNFVDIRSLFLDRFIFISINPFSSRFMLHLYIQFMCSQPYE